MPVRIYDISKKLGLENKEVLAKAKELGIAAARVASSSLDKITAEYLEQQLVQDHPNLASPPAVPAPAAPVHQPIMLVTAPLPPAEVVQAKEPETTLATALLEPPEPPKTSNGPTTIVQPTETPVEPEPVAPTPPAE